MRRSCACPREALVAVGDRLEQRECVVSQGRSATSNHPRDVRWATRLTCDVERYAGILGGGLLGYLLGWRKLTASSQAALPLRLSRRHA